jgi:hypothetical protein
MDPGGSLGSVRTDHINYLRISGRSRNGPSWRPHNSQQVRMMRLEGQLQPNPQRQFIHDMASLVKLLYEKGHDLVLMGDFNESIGANPLGMASVMTAGHLTGAFCHRHDLSQEKPT